MGFLSNILGGGGGGGATGGDAGYSAAVAALQNIGIPTIEAQKIVMETPELVGQLVPEFEGFEQVTDSAMENIEIPDQLKTASLSALSSLEEIADEGGLTPADEAELNAIRREVSGGAQSRDARIMQSLQERGMGGSGMELAQRLASNQSAQQTQAEQADRQAAMAFERKLGALDRVGALGSKLRGQEFGEQSNIAQAKDAIAKFNAQNRAQVGQRNVDRSMTAQEANLIAKQRIADESTRLRNVEETENKSLLQQKFQNEMQKGTALSSAQQVAAAEASKKAAAAAKGKGAMLGGLGKIGGTVVGAYFGGPAGAAIGGQVGGMVGNKIGGGDGSSSGGDSGSMMSDVNMKENIESGDDEIQQMLDNLDSYEYDYKSETGIPGRHVGVMAQDLEQSELGETFVNDTEEGKMVDYSKAAPTMMAALADGNKRLKKLEAMLGLQEDEETIDG